MKKNKNKILFSIFICLIIVFLTIAVPVFSFLNSNNEYYRNEKKILIPIFVYHDIVEEMTAEEFMQTTKENFEEQITELAKLGYKFITYDDLIQYNNGKQKLNEKSIIITFDDGYVGNYEIMYPIIQKYNIPVTINVIDDRIGKVGYLNWEQIKKMEESGLVSIYTHSSHHEDPNTIEDYQYAQNIEQAHKNIEEQLGKKVTKVFTYPYGLNNEEKIKILGEKGFVQNLTDNKVNNSKDLNLNKLHREYPLNDSVAKILIKTMYRNIRYGGK